MSASKWKPYPEYKSTEIEWLSPIPSHWELSRNKNAFTQRKTTFNTDEDTTVLSLTKQGVKVRKNLAFGKSTESFVGHQMVFVDDIVFTPRDFDCTPILSGVAHNEGCISNLYIVVEAIEEVNPEFVNYYWWGLKFHVDYFKQFSQGMRYSFNRESFNQIPLLLPPKNEQDRIFEFLRLKENAIWMAIERLEEKAELLEEKRSALITKAVTMGLNSDVTMKDTGLHWYPKVPSHWNLRKVKHIASIRPSNVDKKKYDGQEEVRLANYVDVYKNDWITEDLELMVATASGDEITKFSLMTGDMIITKDSESWDDIAVPAFVPKTMKGVVCGYHLTLIRPNQEHVLGEFLFRTYQALGVRDQYHYNANGVTRYGLGSYWVNNGVVPVPPIDEQREIAEYIDNNLQIMESIESNILFEIEKLKEFRIALISAAVTGKIDVRGQA